MEPAAFGLEAGGYDPSVGFPAGFDARATAGGSSRIDGLIAPNREAPSPILIQSFTCLKPPVYGLQE